MLETDSSTRTIALKSETIHTGKLEKHGFEPFGQDGFSFLDFLDIINPLQHIPLVSKIYRKITGDLIDPASKIAGSALYGGPIGAVTSLFDVMIENSTGRDIVEHALEIPNQTDKRLEKITKINQNKTTNETAMIINYLPGLRAETVPFEQKDYGITNRDLINGFGSKRNTSNLASQSVLIRKIQAGINIEEQMKANENVRHSQATKAYNSVSHLIKYR